MTRPARCNRWPAIAVFAASVTAVVVGVANAGRPDDVNVVLPETAELCGPRASGMPATFKALVLAKTETAPFVPVPMAAANGDVPLYENLGALAFRITTNKPKAQAYFNQGLRLSFGFNHAEALRSFRAAQSIDPDCAMCFWGEALVLGPNINAPMTPPANEPAFAALTKAVGLQARVTPRERALIAALQKRYASPAPPEREALDAAYADAMKAVAARFNTDDTIVALAAEAAMDTQPWDYWEAGGTRAKGRGAQVVAWLEAVLKRNPSHPGAIHLYIHAIEASSHPEKTLPYARRLAALTPGAGHLVHMPSHIYYRVGMYREALASNVDAIAVDEAYFKRSPSDPMYRAAYYPHNIHFAMAAAQRGGDAKTAIEAATKLDAALSVDAVRELVLLQPIKAAPYVAHAQFSDPATILSLPASPADLVLVDAMAHYARAIAFAAQKNDAGVAAEIDALARIESGADFSPFEPWGVPAKEIVQTARWIATARRADARGDLEGAIVAYRAAIAIEDALAYTEPPYWYYPIRQSLGAIYLRQGRLAEAEKEFRDSLVRAPNSGWILAALIEVERRRGDSRAERAARAAYERAWLGGSTGPDLTKL